MGKSNDKEKCFVIMPISDQGDYPAGHFQKVYEQILHPAIESAGYQPYRVDENSISDQIINKIFAAIQECPMAICDLSNRNPNVLYELGLRQAYDKPVVLVQDDKTERIFDVSGISTIQYKSQRLYENVLEAREKIKQAIIETREGHQNSIVKIVQAKNAQIPSGNVSTEDKIEIMLSSIINEIKDIKNKNFNYYNFNGIDSDSKFLKRNNINIKAGSNISSIRLKNEITDSQIEDEIRKNILISGANIEYIRRGDRLFLKIDDYPSFMVDELIDRIKGALSE